jgi:RNA polymerase sigma factor (sigma-70 family)
MPTRVIDHIRRTVLPRDRADVGDGELLRCFIERRDEAALAALVRRHGPMVWGVCRRLLGHHDAEDALQATFIVLVRKAASIVPREMVGNWLYGVAHQTALQARRSAVRRRAREVQVMAMPNTEAARTDQWPDLQPLLDQELSRLPDHYRAVIVLSDLEGKTRKEVAAQLDCPEGTVASRLVRARAMLAKRLTRRGVALSSAALAAALSQNVASAVMPASVAASTIKAANLFAAGQAVISSKVAALAEGVLKTMLLTKLKSVTAVLVVAAMVGLIGYGIARGQQKGDAVAPQKQESAPKTQTVEDGIVKEKAGKEEAIAWGKEVDGLQAGLVRVPANVSDYRPGESVKLTVKLRNVGKAEVSVTYGMLRDCAPQITTDTGGRVSVSMPPPSYVLYGYALPPIKRALKPGETITLYNPQVAVESEERARLDGEMLVWTPTICVAPGKYKIAFGGMIQSHPRLTTDTVEFEVKDQVAWGKEVGGLQAGLCTAERGPYRHGETITLVIRVRNVGKEAVKFKYIQQYLDENPPTVTGADGKTIPQGKTSVTGVIHVPVEVSLEPGKEVVLESRIHGASGLRYELRPANGGGTLATRDHPLHVGTGKVGLQYEQVFGSSSAGRLELDPTLSKLATGKLELEIKDSPPAPIREGEQGQGREAPQDAKSAYPTADIVVQYRDQSGREVRDLQQFRVEDAETVAQLAAHFPGILGERGSGPRTSAGKRATLTIKFNHKSGEASQMRVAHVTPDYATWWWRDNTPYTGDRQVEGKDQLQLLMERLAAKNKVDLK